MIDLLSLTLAELQQVLASYGMPAFRAKQIFHYVYQQFVFQWDQMTLLPKKDRIVLQEKLRIFIPPVLSTLASEDGTTIKLLLSLQDGHTVETVLMRHDYGNAICLSTQVGCAVNCSFCASAKNGFIRNLTVGEMTAQLLVFRAYVTPELHSIVLMGTGEPLLNYDAVLAFLRHIHEKETFYLGYRNMTLSTSGIVPKMYDLAKENIPLNLAISLHAPNDVLRRTIMPIADVYPLEDILKAADYYFSETHRKVTFEYILIRDVNCTTACATELIRLFARKNVLINAIPINDNYDVGLYRPTTKMMQRFVRIVKNGGISITLRREMGSEIQAACGQLRIQREKVDSI